MGRWLTIVFLVYAFVGFGQRAELPPELDWSGKSESLVRSPLDEWATKAEQTQFTLTSTYSETREWCGGLVKKSRWVHERVIGKSAEGREIIMLLATKEKNVNPETLRKSGKPIFFIQAGIHAGEIDGKDAGMMWLRDMVLKDKGELLNHIHILFIPILNVDGHERSSVYNRPNQRGPENMGWRSNARNRNLNRDYTKLDTEEIRAVVQVLNAYDPDLYFDIHVTDGADYQYDITYGFSGSHGYSPQISSVLAESFQPTINAGLINWGHIPGPLMFAFNGEDFAHGNADYSFGPVYSHGYGAARGIPTVLVENHSLKSFYQRVLGTYVLLQESASWLIQNSALLRSAREKDRTQSVDEVVYSWGLPQDETGTHLAVDSMRLLGVSSERKLSGLTGSTYVQWTGQREAQVIPVYRYVNPEGQVKVAGKYWVSSAYPEIIERLEQHGISFTRLTEDTLIQLEFFKISEFALHSSPNEGRSKVKSANLDEVVRTVKLPKGSVCVFPENQQAILTALLMDPRSTESFFYWGFFNEVLTRTEYIEGYVLEPYMEKMWITDERLRSEWNTFIQENPEATPQQKRQWFYRYSPYEDERYLVVPVGIEWK
jgi:hypothetical protein